MDEKDIKEAVSARIDNFITIGGCEGKHIAYESIEDLKAVIEGLIRHLLQIQKAQSECEEETEKIRLDS